MVSFKSLADTPAMPGMLRKSKAFVPRYQKFESISLQQRVRCGCEPDFRKRPMDRDYQMLDAARFQQ